MESLTSIVRDVMSGYAVEGENGYSYLTQNMDGDVFTVVYISKFGNETSVDTGLLVRITGNRIVIIHDQNDKQLVDALIQAGVPRKQIVLAYAGESIEETA